MGSLQCALSIILNNNIIINCLLKFFFVIRLQLMIVLNVRPMYTNTRSVETVLCPKTLQSITRCHN